MWDKGRLIPSWLLGSLTRRTGNQAVNMDGLALPVGRVLNLNEQGRQKRQNFPGTRPQFGQFSVG